MVVLWASLWIEVDLKSAGTSLLRTRASANSSNSGKLCNTYTLSAGLFWLFQKKTWKVKARHERIKFRKRYIFHNSCAWQKKKRPMSSLSAISSENHLPFLCKASPSNPGLCHSEEWRSETASSCSGLGQPCRGMVTSLTCGRVLLESPWLRASGHVPNSSFSSGVLFSPEGTSQCTRVSQRRASKESPTSAQRLVRQKVKSTSKETI